MNPSLYDDLGVPPDASCDEIKKAYKKAAKKAHPDVGGTDVRFTAIMKAYKILTDETRRARYDSTGDAAESEPDNHYAQVLSTISFHIDRIVQSSIQYGQNLIANNQIDVLVGSMEEQIAEFNKLKIVANKVQQKLKTIVGRFRKRNKAPSIIDTVIRGRILYQQQVISDMDMRINLLKDALQLVKEEEFRIDDVKTVQVKLPWNAERMFGT